MRGAVGGNWTSDAILKDAGDGHFNRNLASVQGTPPAAVDHEDLRRHTVPLLTPRLSTYPIRLVPLPLGGFDIHRAGRRIAIAIPWFCFLEVRRHLQHPRPTADLAVQSAPPHASKILVLPNGELSEVYMALTKHIGRPQWEILALVVYILLVFIFTSPPYMAFSTATMWIIIEN
jgi:hypothetical protein